MTTAKYRTTTLQGQTVHYIEADLAAIAVEDIGKSSVYNSGKFGSNGTFVDRIGGTIWGIACGSGGGEVRNDGERHAGGYVRGTLVSFRPGGNMPAVVTRYRINHISDTGIPLSWINWAIGGMSLHLSVTFADEESFTEKVVDEEHAQSINGVSPAYTAPRTAVGYKSSGAVVIAAAPNATPWMLRLIMKDLGCYEAVMLDGSDLSQLRAKKADGTIVKANNHGTNVWHMVTVTPTTWA